MKIGICGVMGWVITHQHAAGDEGLGGSPHTTPTHTSRASGYKQVCGHLRVRACALGAGDGAVSCAFAATSATKSAVVHAPAPCGCVTPLRQSLWCM